MKILPTLHQTNLQSQLNRAEYLLLNMLINLLQPIKQVKIETLATALPFPITFERMYEKYKQLR